MLISGFVCACSLRSLTLPSQRTDFSDIPRWYRSPKVRRRRSIASGDMSTTWRSRVSGLGVRFIQQPQFLQINQVFGPSGHQLEFCQTLF